MGRFKKFNSVEEMDTKINEYFQYCDEFLYTDRSGKIIKKPYTVSGLCVYLDICRETLNDYSKNPVFSDTIKKARLKIESFLEENSLNGSLNSAVSIFNLKNNFGWTDKTQVDNNVDATIKVKWDDNDSI